LTHFSQGYPCGKWQTAFDVVAIRIEDERSIVVGMVIWAHSGPAVIPATGCDGFIMKSVYGCPIWWQ